MTPTVPTFKKTDGALLEMAPRIANHALLSGRRRAQLEHDVLEARKFARHVIRPRALEIDRKAYDEPGEVAWDILRDGARAGLLSVVTPRAAGGVVDYACLRAAMIIEEVATGCAGFATLFGAHSLGASPLVMGGPAFWDGALKEAAQSTDDERPQIMAFCITEPTAGTDVEHAIWMQSAQIITRADKVKGGYHLSGTKHFISNGNIATWLTVFMPTDPKRPYETLTCFLVRGDAEGLTVANVEHKMGHRASPAAELSFDNVFVSDENVVGRPGDGMALTIGVLAGSRPPVGAIATGIARGAYERLVEWLKYDPAAAGLLDQQQVQLALAQMWEDLHLSRQAYIDAATDFDMVSIGRLQSGPGMRLLAGLPAGARTNAITRKQMNSSFMKGIVMEVMNRSVGNEALTRTLGLSSMAKARGSDAAVKITGMALEIAGLDCGPLRAELEKCYRDAKLTQIYEGTNQLNRLEVFDGLVAEHAMQLLPKPAPAIHVNPAANGKVPSAA
jgi:alkylation response protein AidB-like acyl-CoA dehydrogenase